MDRRQLIEDSGQGRGNGADVSFAGLDEGGPRKVEKTVAPQVVGVKARPVGQLSRSAMSMAPSTQGNGWYAPARSSGQ